VSFALQIIALLLALILVLLSLPVTVAFRIDRSRKTRGKVSVRWLFGLVRIKIFVPGEARAGAKRKKAGKKPGIKKTGPRLRNIVAVLQQARFRHRVLHFIKSLLKATHSRDLYLRLRIGLDDPADTGRLWGILGPLAGMAASLRRAEIRLEPEFSDPLLEVESHGELRLIPLQIIGLATAFLVSPATLQAWFALRRGVA
jgi:hypothetical protein